MVVKLKLLGMGLVLLAAAVLAFLRGLPWHYLACAALGLSWVGDAMLAHYPPVAKGVPDPFLAGMASFSLAQVAYISALWMSLVAMPQRHMQTPGTVLGLHVIGGALPVYLLAATLFWVLFLLRARQPAAVKGAGAGLCTAGVRHGRVRPVGGVYRRLVRLAASAGRPAVSGVRRADCGACISRRRRGRKAL